MHLKSIAVLAFPLCGFGAAIGLPDQAPTHAPALRDARGADTNAKKAARDPQLGQFYSSFLPQVESFFSEYATDIPASIISAYATSIPDDFHSLVNQDATYLPSAAQSYLSGILSECESYVSEFETSTMESSGSTMTGNSALTATGASLTSTLMLTQVSSGVTTSTGSTKASGTTTSKASGNGAVATGAAGSGMGLVGGLAVAVALLG